jgi:hypothetical protein
MSASQPASRPSSRPRRSSLSWVDDDKQSSDAAATVDVQPLSSVPPAAAAATAAASEGPAPETPRTLPKLSAADAAKLALTRKLLDERAAAAKLARKLAASRRAFRLRMESVECSRMESEDHFARMSMRNVKYIDDVTAYDSPTRSVRGIPPAVATAASLLLSGRRSSTPSRAAAAAASAGKSLSASDVFSASGGDQPLDASLFHHQHVRRRSGSLSLGTPVGAAAAAAASAGGSTTGGSVTFAGVRRFGFATAALQTLAQRDNCEHAKALLEQRKVPLPQSLAPETHGLVVRNPLVGPALKELHEELVDWALQLRRAAETSVDNLSFIFDECSGPNRGILRDPRDDFMRELALTAEQQTTLVVEFVGRFRDAVHRALVAASSARAAAMQAGAAGERIAAEDAALSGGVIVAPETEKRPAPLAMAAAVAGFDAARRGPPNRRSIAVQAGTNREQQLVAEADDLRASLRALQRDSIQREQAKDADIASLGADVARLRARLDLLHQCLHLQRQQGASGALSRVSDADVATLANASERSDDDARVDAAMAAIAREVSHASRGALGAIPVLHRPPSGSTSAAASRSATPVPAAPVAPVAPARPGSGSASSPDENADTRTFGEAEAAALAAAAAVSAGGRPSSASVTPVARPLAALPVGAPLTPPDPRPAALARRLSGSAAAGAVLPPTFPRLAVAAGAANDTSASSLASSSATGTPRDLANNNDSSFSVLPPLADGAASSSASTSQPGSRAASSAPAAASSGAFRFPPAAPRSPSTAPLGDQRPATRGRAAGSAAPAAKHVDSCEGPLSSSARGGSFSHRAGGGAAASTRASPGLSSVAASNANARAGAAAPSGATGAAAAASGGPLPVNVVSSLRRMEEWKEQQAALWERRRSQLEKHQSYDGMLKFSGAPGDEPPLPIASPADEVPQPRAGAANAGRAGHIRSGSGAGLGAVAIPTTVAPLPTPTPVAGPPQHAPFAAYDVLVDGSRRQRAAAAPVGAIVAKRR